MKSTRVAVTVFALAVSTAAVARAQNRAARMGGGGSGVSATTNQSQTHTHVAYQGPSLVVSGNALTSSNSSTTQGQASGGSWSGARPTSGGSPAAQPRQQGTDLTAFFGYVPPRGETAQDAPDLSVARGSARRAARGVTAPTVTAPQEHHPRITWP